jgi:hypothetical protein
MLAIEHQDITLLPLTVVRPELENSGRKMLKPNRCHGILASVQVRGTQTKFKNCFGISPVHWNRSFNYVLHNSSQGQLQRILFDTAHPISKVDIM